MLEKTKNLLPIPLPDNTKTGWSCGEVAVIAALEYLGIEPLPDEEQARVLTHKIPEYNTWPEQLLRIAFAFSTVGAVIYRLKSFTIPASEHVRKQYPAISAERLLRETDINDLEAAIKECEKNNHYLTKDFTLETILLETEKGNVVIPWVCFDTLYGRNTDKGFNAHYVIVTGFDSYYIYVHECGGINKLPEANNQIRREQFIKALGPDPIFMVWSHAV